MLRFRISCLAAALALGVMANCPASAQGLEQGKVEVGGFGGAVHARNGGGATKGLFGGGLAYGLAPRAAVYFDFSYIPLESESFRGLGVVAEASARMYAFEGGINIHLGSPDGKAVPYVVAGGGLGRSSYEARGTFGGRTFSESGSESGGLAGGGMGVRFYVGKNWVFKPEFRIQRGFGEGEDVTFYRFQAGVFYQFGT